MKRKIFLDDPFPKLLLKIQRDIAKLSAAVMQYDYSQLRVVITSKKNEEQIARASNEGIEGLLAMFSQKFLSSSDKELQQYYKNLHNWPVSQYDNVIKLADILINFKKKVAEAEEKYFQGIGKPACAQLKTTSAWVIRFHYCVEQQIDNTKESSLFKYKNFIMNVKKLSETIFFWIEKNAPGKQSLYETLQPENNCSSNKENENPSSSSFLETKTPPKKPFFANQKTDVIPSPTLGVKRKLF